MQTTKGSLNNIFQDLFNKVLSQKLTHDRFYISHNVADEPKCFLVYPSFKSILLFQHPAPNLQLIVKGAMTMPKNGNTAFVASNRTKVKQKTWYALREFLTTQCKMLGHLINLTDASSQEITPYFVHFPDFFVKYHRKKRAV